MTESALIHSVLACLRRYRGGRIGQHGSERAFVQLCATGRPLRRPKTTERPEISGLSSIVCLVACSQFSLPRVTTGVRWDSWGRLHPISGGAFTTRRASNGRCAFCATKWATRRRTIWRCGGRRLVGTCDSYDVVLTTLSNSDRDSSVGNRLTENEKRIHSCPA